MEVWTMLSCTLFPLLHSTGRSYCTIKYLSSILSWLHIFILWLSCNKFTLSLCFFLHSSIIPGNKATVSDQLVLLVHNYFLKVTSQN